MLVYETAGRFIVRHSVLNLWAAYTYTKFTFKGMKENSLI